MLQWISITARQYQALYHNHYFTESSSDEDQPPSFSMGGPSKRPRLSIDEEAKSDSGEENGESDWKSNNELKGQNDGKGSFGSSSSYSSAAQRMMVSDRYWPRQIWKAACLCLKCIEFNCNKLLCQGIKLAVSKWEPGSITTWVWFTSTVTCYNWYFSLLLWFLGCVVLFCNSSCHYILI